MKNINDSLDDIMEAMENMNGRIVALTDLIEAMVLTHQDVYAKVEFLEKRIKLVEFVNDCQDKEMELSVETQEWIKELVDNGGMGK